MLLTAYLKPLSKTRKEPPAINSTVCLASWKTASKEFPLKQITTLSLNISRKEGLIISPGSCLPYFTTQRRMPTEEFLLVFGPKSSPAEKKQHPNTEVFPPNTKCPSLLPVAVALLLHMKLIGTFLALTLQISEAALQI